MKKALFILGLTAIMSASCVSMGEMERKEAELEQKNKEYNLVRQELFELKEESNNLSRQYQTMTNDMADMVAERERNVATIDSLSRIVENMQQRYDTTMENYLQEISGKTRDLNRAQNMLTARTKELSDKEAAFRQKEAALEQRTATLERQQTDLLARQKTLEQQEAATRAQLEAKERELETIRASVTKALTGFADKGLNVETKDGKVYVSMENKLLFPSASWTVSKEGVNAIKELAKVLEADSTLNIMVEGHTDNDAYHGSTAVKDNWDLSVMRATAIVKLLIQHGPGINPARIEACGHGEFAPKVANDSPANKAINRRTEIILTPKLTDIMKIVE
ncbi:MAG: OmpA family protein [Bacteroidales bacterium]|nr:OmpA family protein [Bacteroidales bacterium]